MPLTAFAASTPLERSVRLCLTYTSSKKEKQHPYQSLSWLPQGKKKATESLPQSFMWFPLFPWALTPSLFHFLSVFQPQDVGHSTECPDSF